jgi:uncharacterized MnhB-related membrane protein
MILTVFDTVLAAAMIWLGWWSLTDRDLFRGVVKFVALGLLVAVSWVRLNALDVALAEAAIGSGLTGALILSAAVRMRRREHEQMRSTRKEVAE